MPCKHAGTVFVPPWRGRRWSGHPGDVETGRDSGAGVFVAADVHYLASGCARAAAVVATDAAFSRLAADRTTLVPGVQPYRPGEFWLRELPPLRAVLDGLTGMTLLVIDGYADLDPDGRLGLGARARDEFGVPVIGVVKSPFRTATHAISVLRGTSAWPLYVTAAGIPPPTQPASSDTWSAATVSPMPSAAPTPSPAMARLHQCGAERNRP
jgi:deoxyribonuclease V